MPMRGLRASVLAVVSLVLVSMAAGCDSARTPTPVATAPAPQTGTGFVSSAHPLATEAGLDVLRRGVQDAVAGLQEVRATQADQAKAAATPAIPNGPVKNTSMARLKLCSCSINSVKVMNSMIGMPAAMDEEPLLLSSTAPATSMR